MYKKISEKFKNKYLRKLSIFDHLHECIQRYGQYKLSKKIDRPTYEHEYDKELMDLLILLQIHKSADNKTEELYKSRLKAFVLKIDNMES